MYTAVALTILSLVLPSVFGAALIKGIDNSVLVSEATYKKAKSEGFSKLVIRGYEEACGVGGEVDPNFLKSYNNARAAGYTNIDAYWFPCNGSGRKCKSYKEQITDLGKVIDTHKMKIGRIWIDMEVDPVCNNWNYGHAGNLAQAKDMVAAAKASKRAFGIYSSPGEWGNMFGSESAEVAPTVPLWFATFDNDASSLKMHTPFGGWKSAVGKQYTDKSASGDFDLNIFS